MKSYSWRTENFDISQDVSMDITNPLILRDLIKRIRNKELSAIMLGTPCAAFSVARDRTCQIRSVNEPWGLIDRSKFSRNVLLSLEHGNCIAKATIKVLNLCLGFTIPAILENPHSSRLWHLPQIKRILTSKYAFFMISDFC